MMGRPKPRRLTETQAAAFREEGFVAPVSVLDLVEVSHYLACLAAFETRHGRVDRHKLRTKAHLLAPWINALVRHDALLDAVEDVLGPDILCWGCGFIIKEPGDGAFVSMHQDGYYWQWEPHEQVTAWLALTPATRESGAMRMVPMPVDRPDPIVPHEENWQADNLLMRGQTASGVDISRAVDVELRPGEMSLHHEYTPHASSANRAAHRRIGFSIQYVTPRMREIGERTSASLVRGRDRFGHFDPEPVPQCDYDPAALAVFEAQQARYKTVASRAASAIADAGSDEGEATPPARSVG